MKLAYFQFLLEHSEIIHLLVRHAETDLLNILEHYFHNTNWKNSFNSRLKSLNEESFAIGELLLYKEENKNGQIPLFQW